MVDELVPSATTWEGSGLLAVGVESMLAPSACVCVCWAPSAPQPNRFATNERNATLLRREQLDARSRCLENGSLKFVELLKRRNGRGE